MRQGQAPVWQETMPLLRSSFSVLAMVSTNIIPNLVKDLNKGCHCERPQGARQSPQSSDVARMGEIATSPSAPRNDTLFIQICYYSAYSPDLPGCVSTGATREEVESNMREAIEFHLEGLRLESLPIPEPSSQSAYVDIAA